MKPQDVLTISEPVEKMYMDCTSQLIINLCRHFKDGKSLASRDWEIKKLSELGALTNESIEIISANTGQSAKSVKMAVKEAMSISLSDVEKTLASASKNGLIRGANTTLDASPSVAAVVENLTQQAVEDTNIVNTVMLQSVRNQYVKAINQTMYEEQRLIEQLQSASNLETLDAQLQKTQDVLNSATMSVATGTEARTSALRRAIGALAAEGITGYIDAGGHHWSPEAYINMDIRTTVHNAAIQGQKARSSDYGVETFQVSTHSGARPLCAPYQGKFYSWGSDSGYVFDIDGNRYRYESIHSTSYGEPAGLFGINCGHFPQTFVSGFSTPRYEPMEDEEENNRIYQESQEQRAIERDIRKWKTEALSYQAAGDEVGFEKAALKVKEKNANYKAFCKETGRTPRNERTQVFGYNRSTAAKANAATQKIDKTIKLSYNDKYSSAIKAFVPAEGIAEAERIAATMVDTSRFAAFGVSYKGLKLSAANEINKELKALYESFRVEPFGGIAAPAENTKLGKRVANARAFYNSVQHGFVVNRHSMNDYEAEYLKETQLLADILKNPKKYNLSALPLVTQRTIARSTTSGRLTVAHDIASTMDHEFGHALQSQVKQNADWTQALNNMPTFADKISGYAGENENEYIAESFASYIAQENLADPVIVKIFNSLRR